MRHCLWVLWIVKYSCSRTHGGIVGVAVCQWLFVLNGMRRRSLWFCALSSWRRLDSCGLGKDVTTLTHVWCERHWLCIFDFSSGGMLPCLMLVYSYMFDRWYPDMIWHVWCPVGTNTSDSRSADMFWQVWFPKMLQVVHCHVLACFGMFVSARWYTDMFWQMVVSCLLEHFWQVLYWVADRTRQDHAKIQKKGWRACLLWNARERWLPHLERATKTRSTSDLCTPIPNILSISWQHLLRSVWSLPAKMFSPKAFRLTLSTSLDSFCSQSME